MYLWLHKRSNNRAILCLFCASFVVVLSHGWPSSLTPTLKVVSMSREYQHDGPATLRSHGNGSPITSEGSTLLSFSPTWSAKKLAAFREKRFADYQATQSERSGPGEQGVPLPLGELERQLAEEDAAQCGYYRRGSDAIALDRAIPDNRPPECKSVTYPEDLPDLSAIVTFYNEAPSVVLRTAHSVINRTPPRYLREVILCDSGSTNDELGRPLEDYVRTTWPDGIVKILRVPENIGVAHIRNQGAQAASGDVLVILDGHVEVTQRWAEPLLARLAESPDSLVGLSLGVIHWDTLAISPAPVNAWLSLGFTWAMANHWDSVDVLPGRPDHVVKPHRSVAVSGGAHAMRRETLKHFGYYDDGMRSWGGEDLEIGFLFWLCGGRVEYLACSVVNHLYRHKGKPYNTTDTGFRNFRRIAEIWLGEYKKYYYAASGDKPGDIGDTSLRMGLKNRLKCNSISWILDNVFPKFMFDVNTTRSGQIRNVASGRCLDGVHTSGTSFPIKIRPCRPEASSTQLFALTTSGFLRSERHCVTYRRLDKTQAAGSPGGALMLDPVRYKCHDTTARWRYDSDTGQFVLHGTGLCLDAGLSADHGPVAMAQCGPSKTQVWQWTGN